MAELKHLHLGVEGMHCAACVRRVKVALEKLPGVRVESVEIGSANVAYDPQQLDAGQITSAVDKIGFSASAAA